MEKFTDKYNILQHYFGYTQFRPGQESVIDALLSGQDVMAVMPTGAGKSLCYQIPALMSDGITIVISPLISLMHDQVVSLGQSGIRAAYINSSLTNIQYNSVINNVQSGLYKIIYVAPERLESESFVSLAKRINISMIAVDEAHCISQWGQDFRPSYMKIPDFIHSLPHRPVVGAFTATATQNVKSDIINILGLIRPYSITTGFDRTNLYFGVIHSADKYADTLDIVRQYKDKSGIIYCATRKNVDTLCEKLNKDGIPCTRYHAGLSDEERKCNQDNFIFDRVSVIAATNAFGMGIDKSNISYVIHYNMPKDIESYYQEAGRAGRDGSEAKCILLYSGQDIMTNRRLIEQTDDNPGLNDVQKRLIRDNRLQKLKDMINYCNTGSCLRAYILNYFAEQHNGHCDNCSSCLDHTEQIDITVDAQKILSCIARLRQRDMSFGKIVISAILHGSDSEKIKQFGLKTLSTYGIMQDKDQKTIRRITDKLIADGYITEDEYHGLALTDAAWGVLKNRIKLTMPISRIKSGKSNKSGVNISKQSVSFFDKELFVRLAAIRFRIAQKIGMPPYIVFSDATLKEMSARKPVTEQAMLAVSGVGQVKLANYGAEFLSAILQYIDQHHHSDNAGNTHNGHHPQSDETLSDMIIRRQTELTARSEGLTLTQLAEDILTQLGITAKSRDLLKAIRTYLIDAHYLTEVTADKRTRMTTTDHSQDIGIIPEERISSRGESYTAILFTHPAQEFIYRHIEEICNNV